MLTLNLRLLIGTCVLIVQFFAACGGGILSRALLSHAAFVDAFSAVGVVRRNSDLELQADSLPFSNRVQVSPLITSGIFLKFSCSWWSYYFRLCLSLRSLRLLTNDPFCFNLLPLVQRGYVECTTTLLPTTVMALYAPLGSCILHRIPISRADGESCANYGQQPRSVDISLRRLRVAVLLYRLLCCHWLLICRCMFLLVRNPVLTGRLKLQAFRSLRALGRSQEHSASHVPESTSR